MSEDKKVLIVDDVFAARRVLKRLLGKLGYTNITDTETGKAAIEKLKEEAFDLIICDLNLGDVQGTDVLATLPETEHNPKTPFILITSDLSKEDLASVLKKNIAACLLKPFDKGTLKDAIEESMGIV